MSKNFVRIALNKNLPTLFCFRLRGERGLAVLPKLFENTKFKGKGHEVIQSCLCLRCLHVDNNVCVS